MSAPASEQSQQSPQPQQVLQVRHDDHIPRYANHVLVSTGAEEVFLDFTSGVVTDRGGVSVLPVHTRIAMTPSGVVRLAQLLAQTVQRFQVVNVNPPAPAEPPTDAKSVE